MRTANAAAVKSVTLSDVWANTWRASQSLQAGSIKPAVAKEINNSAGKMIAVAKAHLEFAKLSQCAPTPEFFSDQQQQLAKLGKRHAGKAR